MEYSTATIKRITSDFKGDDSLFSLFCGWWWSMAIGGLFEAVERVRFVDTPWNSLYVVFCRDEAVPN